MKKTVVKLLKKLEWGSALGVRLTHWTGKASIPTHPKHLINVGQLYYLKYIRPQDVILDLGSHAGEHALKSAITAKRVVGLDINRKLLHQAKAEARRRDIKNVVFKYHDLEKKLPFKRNQFDKVLFFAVLEHIHQRDQLLQEIHRILKPNGQLFLSVPNKNTAWKKLQRSVGFTGFSDPDHKLEFTRSEISTLLKKHKFTHVDVLTTAIDTPLAGVIDALGGISLALYKRLLQWKITEGKKHPRNTVGFLIRAYHG